MRQVVRVMLFCQDHGIIYTLLLRRAEGQRNPFQDEGPGGKVEEGEDLEEAAYRTIEEETGIDLQAPLYFLGDHSFENDQGKFEETFFLSFIPKKIDPYFTEKEHDHFAWVRYEDLFKANFHPRIRVFLKDHELLIDEWLLKATH